MNKTILPFIIILILSLFNSSCSREKENEFKQKRFGATYMTMNNPFFGVINSGIEKIVEQNNDELIVFDPALDYKKQIHGIENFIAQKVDAIFLNPTHWKKIKPALLAAKKAQIPVFIVDAPVFDNDLVVSTISSDNFQAGVLCANHLIYKLKIISGNIVLLINSKSKSALERIEGFESIIKGYPDLKVVAKDECRGQTEIAMPVMEKILKKETSKITAVMCVNDPSAFGAIAALEKVNRLKGTYVYGVDGRTLALKLIKEGKMTATIIQYPIKIGDLAAKAAYRHLSKGKVKTEIKVPVKIIDKEG
jgi:ribose transport system substrate-binding protein